MKTVIQLAKISQHQVNQRGNNSTWIDLCKAVRTTRHSSNSFKRW